VQSQGKAPRVLTLQYQPMSEQRGAAVNTAVN
jgi:hypothetical protein